LIFDLPWPAHRAIDVMDYPPPHLLPPNYLPPRITSVPLPSLSKVPKRPPVLAPQSPPRETREFRRARLFRNLLALEEFTVDQLRLNAWNDQLAKEAIELAKEEAKAKIKREKEEAKEAKKRLDAKTVKGSGVWSRYEYLSVDELKKRTEEKWAVTSGTRRGGTFRDKKDEEEMKKLAEVQRTKELEERLRRIDQIEGDDGGIVVRGGSRVIPPPVEIQDMDPDITLVESDLPEVKKVKPVSLTIANKKRQSESEASPSTPSRSRTSSPPLIVKVNDSRSLAKTKPDTAKTNGSDQITITAAVVAVLPTSDANGTVKRGRGRPAGTGHLQRRAAALQKNLDTSTIGSSSTQSIPAVNIIANIAYMSHSDADTGDSIDSTGSSAGVLALLEDSEAGERSIETLSEEIEVEEAEVGLQIQVDREKRKKRISDESEVGSSPTPREH